MLKESHLKIYEVEENSYPVIKRISRSEQGDWLIEWEASTDFNFKYYQIYRKNSFGSFEPFVKVWKQLENRYQIAYRSNWESSQCFKVEVVKYCSEKSVVEQIPEYCSINLEVEKKADLIQLNWTDYPIENRLKYQVFRKKWGASSFELIGETDTSTLSYVDSTLLCPEIYVYQVKLLADDESYSVWSDTVNVKPNNLVDDYNIELKRITVVDDKQVLLEWETVAGANEIANELYLSKKNSRGSFSIIENLPLTSTSYLDNNAQIGNQPLEYKLALANNCKSDFNLTGVFASIHLSLEQQDVQVKLKWTTVKGLKSGVEYYLVQRQQAGGEWETIKRVEKGEGEVQLNFEDN